MFNEGLLSYVTNVVVITNLTLYSMIAFQIRGKLYLRIDRIGEGAKWRRTVGQEIYSPLLLAFTEQVTERKGNEVSFFFFEVNSFWEESNKEFSCRMRTNGRISPCQNFLAQILHTVYQTTLLL